jgi:hypothetical protein
MEYVDVHRFLVDVLHKDLLQKIAHDNRNIRDRHDFAANVPENKIMHRYSDVIFEIRKEIIY